MKKIYGFVIVIISLLQTAHAQEREYKEVWCNYWASTINGVYFVDHVLIKGDTTFHAIPYKKLSIKTEVYKYAKLTTTLKDSLISSSTRFIGGYREDSGRVYVAAIPFDTSMHEKLVYNYNLKQEDTAEVWVNLIGYQKFIIDSVFEVTIHDGSTRKIYTFSETVNRTPLNAYWIEGIGCSYGLLNMHFVYINDESRYLRCVKEDHKILYDHIPAYNDDCLAKPDQNCDVMTGYSKLNLIEPVVYPNPVHDKLYIETNGNKYYYKIDNLLGQTVHSGFLDQSDGSIKLDLLKPGTYLLKLTGDHAIVTKKILKL